MSSFLKLNIGCFLALALVFACKKKSTSTTNPAATEFDRKAMLTNIGSNIIVPSYNILNSSALQLDSAVSAFNANPDQSRLAGMQNVFKNLYKAWQACSELELGPADQETLNENLNTFPADSGKINANISSGSYELAAIANLSAKGFPAMDYLLFGSDNISILGKYTSGDKAAGRRQYLAALALDIKNHVTTVYKSWTSGGYLDTFINAAGTDVGSSLGQLVNTLDHDLDNLKNYKLGIPLGKQSMGTLYPAKVESYYNGNSAELIVLQLKAMQNIYLGKSDRQDDGLGIDDYLVQLKAPYNNGLLNDAIKNQFTAAINKMQAVPDPLSNSIQADPNIVNAAYVEAQKLIVLLKTDMASSLGILITYVDNDGD